MKNDFDRIAATYRTLKTLDLPVSIINQVFLLNDSNENPYHNFQHLLTVALRSIEGAKYYNLSQFEQQALFIAGLSHDAMYSVGKSEFINISKAQEFSEMICRKNNFDNEFTQHVKVLIKATEFPHNKAMSIHEEIIQDADLMQALEDDCEIFLQGLCSEKDDPNIADPRFPGIEGFNTQWAKEVYSKKFI